MFSHVLILKFLSSISTLKIDSEQHISPPPTGPHKGSFPLRVGKKDIPGATGQASPSPADLEHCSCAQARRRLELPVPGHPACVSRDHLLQAGRARGGPQKGWMDQEPCEGVKRRGSSLRGWQKGPIGGQYVQPVSVAPPCTSAAPGDALSPWKYQLEPQKTWMMSRLAGPAFVLLPATPWAWRAKVALAQRGQGGFQDQTQMGKSGGSRSF